jgi:hypothetical protein
MVQNGSNFEPNLLIRAVRSLSALPAQICQTSQAHLPAAIRASQSGRLNPGVY